MLKFRSNSTPQHALDYRRPNSNERMFGRGNELNANDKRDALGQLQQLLASIDRGETVMADPDKDVTITASEKNIKFKEAYYDRNSDKWARMGKSLAAEVYEQVRRQGFCRNLTNRIELTGSRPEIEVYRNDVSAVVMTTGAMLAPQYPQNGFLYPGEFTIHANVRAYDLDIQRSSGDLLDRRYNDCLEAIMVTEDRAWKKMADEMAGIEIPQIDITGNLTPALIVYMRQLMIDNGLTPTNIVMSNTYINDIMVGPEFQAVYDPATQYNLIQSGTILNFYGLNFTTDAARKPNLRVLDKGDFYMTALPEEHAAYTDRGPVEANPVDQYPDGQPSRGWYAFEHTSMTMLDPFSIIRARRA